MVNSDARLDSPIADCLASGRTDPAQDRGERDHIASTMGHAAAGTGSIRRHAAL
jgi:hypothetical protein